MRDVAAGTLAFLLIIGIGICFWWIGRRVNYEVWYKEMVLETIRETVKPEALQQPSPRP